MDIYSVKADGPKCFRIVKNGQPIRGWLKLPESKLLRNTSNMSRAKADKLLEKIQASTGPVIIIFR